MRLVLESSIESLVPGSSGLVKKHVWRNPDYVGMSNCKVSIWQGWNANLAKSDRRYKTLYIDYVTRDIPPKEQERLFGNVFFSAIQSINPFIFFFVTSCAYADIGEVISAGFTFRQINDVIHPGVIVGIETFMETPIENWSSVGVKLLHLQHRLRN